MTTLPHWPRMLLTLMLSTALLFGAPNVAAQNSAPDSNPSCGPILESLEEMETLATEFADQRDRALRLAEKNRTQRDVCEGRLAELSTIIAGLQVTQRDYEATIARYEARPKPHVVYLAGFLTPIAVVGIGALVWVAVK